MALAANPKLCRPPLPPGAPLAFVLPARMSLLQERRLIFPFTGSTSQDHIDKDHGLFVMGETDMERAAQGCFLGNNDICFFSLAEDTQTSQPFTLKPLQVPFCSVISSIYVAEKLTQHIWPFFFFYNAAQLKPGDIRKETGTENMDPMLTLCCRPWEISKSKNVVPDLPQGNYNIPE